MTVVASSKLLKSAKYSATTLEINSYRHIPLGKTPLSNSDTHFLSVMLSDPQSYNLNGSGNKALLVDVTFDESFTHQNV